MNARVHAFQRVTQVAKMLLDDNFYDQPCHALSKALLHKLVCRRLTDAEVASIPNDVRQHALAVDGEPLIQARIVETESYPSGDDKATHSCQGRRTARTEPMFMKPGTAYVYLIYGIYNCVNISSREPGAAVLLRALEPVRGETWARALRIQKTRRKPILPVDGVLALVQKTSPPVKSCDIFNGPSKLCQALAIDCANFNKHDLALGIRLWLEDDDVAKQNSFVENSTNVVACTRIGVNGYGDVAANQPWRWYVRDSLSVSKRDRKAELAGSKPTAKIVCEVASNENRNNDAVNTASSAAARNSAETAPAIVVEKKESKRSKKRIRLK